jgi:hypothetical protein
MTAGLKIEPILVSLSHDYSGRSSPNGRLSLQSLSIMLVDAVQSRSGHCTPPDSRIPYCLVREPHAYDVYTIFSLRSRTCGHLWPPTHRFASSSDSRRSVSMSRHKATTLARVCCFSAEEAVRHGPENMNLTRSHHDSSASRR